MKKKQLANLKPIIRTFEGNNPITNKELYLTDEELVERFRGKVTKRTLANWRSNGEGPRPTKIGGRVLYKIVEVVELEKQRTVQA